ncbi:U3 small nucleolar RNA-interacting protein 2-like isoform X2 [Penaeus japonicus]|uniref:U3 small nucleolar RNA-interacting protein 2-like isoform X2 n=1 Tax=Penaeus japonicus TaxID=27405 RepID=UPI001C715B6C|nr:U3 small nucleolar RNA-interacting protein 2-like isoform X2 [Penaeus japonicus]
MPFFIRGKRPLDRSDKKPKRGIKRNAQPPTKRPPKERPNMDEEITSDEEDEYIRGKPEKFEEYETDEDLETPQEKKVRLARQYIKELEEQKASAQEARDVDYDAIGHRLREDVLEASGKLYKPVAETIAEADTENILTLKSKQQKLPVTCMVVTSDDQHIFCGSKDCSLVKYTIDGKRVATIPGGRKGTEKVHVGHTTHVYSLAVSSDGMYLASGDQGGYIHIWNAKTMEHLKSFKKHRAAISGLVFRRGSHTLYSCSHDRMVIVWNIDAMAFVEHLGGHQDAITGIDALYRESCITSGGRDQSVIVYVIVEDKQLRFAGHQDSIDGVKLLNEKTFFTYSQDGTISMWITSKKRPQSVHKAAHGYQSNGQPHWITAIATLVNSDLLASGSMDGFIRLWKINTGKQRGLEPILSIPVGGVVNSLAFTSNASHLVAGVGREHKLGRWYCIKSGKNSVLVIPLKKK